ncbi:DUF4326 domain-containing protein [Acrocarpospora catenulata]|uniref:DUF4326 domain-containing protein n=1 Tax=Acrocarpospora catenulata TaxID=2836182 RepID=UPI001BDB6639|nr:DUF4326 domain-containing protein [Acrocarpospora catenulata]
MNQRRGHPRLIAWAKSENLYARIDSRSIWGNPHEKDDVLRGEQLRRYEAHLHANPGLLAQVGELRGMALGCWCTHGPCHGQILKLLADGPTPPTPAAVPNDLTAEEKTALAEAESAIERGLTTFVDVGHALSRIRSERLYRGTHARFEDYCRDRWGFTKNHVNRQIDAARVMGTLAITHIPRQHPHPTNPPAPTPPQESNRLGELSGLRAPNPTNRPEDHPTEFRPPAPPKPPSPTVPAPTPGNPVSPSRIIDNLLATFADYPALITATTGFEKETTPQQARLWSQQLARGIHELQKLQRKLGAFLDTHG